MDILIVIGWLIVIVFYASYFTKMMLQKIKGIKTDQLARGTKPRKTYLIEGFLKLMTYLTALAQLVSMLFIHQLPIIFTNSILRMTIKRKYIQMKGAL